jgi:hypothetical protein
LQNTHNLILSPPFLPPPGHLVLSPSVPTAPARRSSPSLFFLSAGGAPPRRRWASKQALPTYCHHALLLLHPHPSGRAPRAAAAWEARDGWLAPAAPRPRLASRQVTRHGTTGSEASGAAGRPRINSRWCVKALGVAVWPRIGQWRRGQGSMCGSATSSQPVVVCLRLQRRWCGIESTHDA